LLSSRDGSVADDELRPGVELCLDADQTDEALSGADELRELVFEGFLELTLGKVLADRPAAKDCPVWTMRLKSVGKVEFEPPNVLEAGMFINGLSSSVGGPNELLSSRTRSDRLSES
jgi:hypothetical protein